MENEDISENPVPSGNEGKTIREKTKSLEINYYEWDYLTKLLRTEGSPEAYTLRQKLDELGEVEA